MPVPIERLGRDDVYVAFHSGVLLSQSSSRFMVRCVVVAPHLILVLIVAQSVSSVLVEIFYVTLDDLHQKILEDRIIHLHSTYFIIKRY